MTITERIRIAREQEFLTVEQFALLTQYHPQSIYRMIKRGSIPVLRLGRIAIRIPRSAARTVRAQHPSAMVMEACDGTTGRTNRE